MNKERVLSYALSLLVGLVCLWLLFQQPLVVSLSMSSSMQGNGQVFWNDGKGYDSQKSKSIAISPGENIYTYEIAVPKGGKVNSIRVDPLDKPGNIRIHKIQLSDGFKSEVIDFGKIRALNDIQISRNDDFVEINSTGSDPYFDFDIFVKYDLNYFELLAITAFSLIIFFAIKKLMMHKNYEFHSKVYLALIVIGTILFLALKLNMSSLPMWGLYTGGNNMEGVIIGEPRGIRSDEWLVQTPYYASQVKNNFALENKSIGPGNSTLLAGVPTSTLYGYSQPRYWGFFLFGFEHGLSWLYTFRIFGLLASSFFLLYLVTKRDGWASIFGSIWIAYSSFNQWWFSTNLPDMLIGCFLSVYLIYKIYFSKQLKYAIPMSVLLYFSGATFAAALYPAFQVPLGYLAITLIFGLILRDRNGNSEINYFNYKMLLLCLVLILLGISSYTWFEHSKNIIDLVGNSVYPGKRLVQGGDLSWAQFYGGYLGPIETENSFPKILGNICEASGFFFYFPIFLLLFCGRLKRVFSNPLNLALLAYLLIFLAWFFIGFGEIAKYTLLSYSPPNRAIVGFGVAGIILLISVFSDKSLPTIKSNSIIIFINILVLLAIFIPLKIIFNDYLILESLLFLALIVLLINYAYLTKNNLALIGAICLICFSCFLVNPIVKGSKVFDDKEFISFLNSLGPVSERRWVSYGNIVHPQYLKAYGESVFNGAKYMPELSDMYILDPSNMYKEIWYRYSHFLVNDPGKKIAPTFQLKQTDVVELVIYPCSKILRELNVTNLTFPSKQNLNSNPCLIQLNDSAINGLWFYKIKK